MFENNLPVQTLQVLLRREVTTLKVLAASFNAVRLCVLIREKNSGRAAHSCFRSGDVRFGVSSHEKGASRLHARVLKFANYQNKDAGY